LYILIFTFFRQQTRRQNFCAESIIRIQFPLISSRIRFWFIIVVPKYLNCATFSKHLLLSLGHVIIV
jgi:hypothetical protein